MTEQLLHGTVAWFDMVGAEIVKAAAQFELPRDLRFSVIERYVDGADLGDGLCQGLRISVADGRVVCRTGARADETADVVIEVTAVVARELNLLFGADPAHRQALNDAIASGELRTSGDLGSLGPVFDMAHDRIVERTI